MKKYLKTTLGHKLLAFYLAMFAITFYAMSIFGHGYIRNRVYSETADNLHSVGATLLSSHINQQRYTKTTIRNFNSQLNIAAEAAECQILVICNDGDILIDTDSTTPVYNVYQGDSSFLHSEYTEHTTLDGYLSADSLCVSITMEENPYLNGYLLLAQPSVYVDNRVTYYANILSILYYIIMLIVGFVFILIYIFNARPLRKLRDGIKDFSINHENPPIRIRSHDEYGEMAHALNIIGEELSKFDEYQRRFISNISHDFRSPLTNIQGYIQAMADGIISPESQGKYLDIILYETERLTKLTNDLVDVNNFDRDHIFLNIDDFDLQEAITKTCDSLQLSAKRKQIQIDFTPLSPDGLYVRADQDKILLVLHNLLDNAIKFSHTGSVVTVRIRMKGEKVFVSVKDTGIGIPKEDLNRIWDRFYKTDLSRGKDKFGTGLGLSICKEIINAHKQTIDVVSTVGVGSEFVFTLPKA